MRRLCRSRNTRSTRGSRTCRLEPLETRSLFSIGSGAEIPLGWDGPVPLGWDEVAPAVVAEETALGFDKDTSAFWSGTSGPLADATPTGSSYMLYEHWGGTWWDAEKTISNTEDDLMCWAAAASNVLVWTGWGEVSGMATADQVFAYFQNHWTDQGGMMSYGWEWWFTGVNPAQGSSGWSQVDVAGGGFYPGETFDNYLFSQSDPSQAMTAIDSYLHAGYGVSLGIYNGSGGGHAITVWGYNYDPGNPTNYVGVWITDSDDDKSTDSPPDRLRYYQVAHSGGAWYLQNYYGSNSWYIGAVQALASRNPQPQEGAIRGTVWEDANGDGQHQAGEAGLAGQTVYLDANNNGQLDLNTSVIVSTDVPKAILDRTTTRSTLTFSGDGVIADVNLTLNIAHTYVADLVAYLVSPSGTRIELFANIGGGGRNFTNTTLDDEASTSILWANAPFTGSFRPHQALSRFDGENAHGVWALEISDTADWDTGSLLGWSLEINTDEVRTQTAADGTYVFTGLDDGTYWVRHAPATGWIDTYPASGVHQVTLEGEAVENVDFTAAYQAAQPSPTNLGQVDFRHLAGLNPSGGDLWFSLSTTRQGYLTLEALFAGPGEELELALYDAGFNRLTTATPSEGVQRIDWQANAGTTYLVSLRGSLTDVNLRLCNLVSPGSGGCLTIYGTSGDDRLDFAAAAWHQVTICGVHYAFDATEVNAIRFIGQGGSDTAVLCTSAGDDTAVVRANSATLTGPNYTLTAQAVRDIIVINPGGTDTAQLVGSAGDDRFDGHADYAEMYGLGFYYRVEGFAFVQAYGGAGGNDSARLYDSSGNDSFVGRPEYSRLSGDTFFLCVKDFDRVHAYRTAGGRDVAYLYDSAGDDTFDATATYGRITGPGYYVQANGFVSVVAQSTAGGQDTARLYDSPGNDTLTASPAEAVWQSAAFRHRAVQFESIVAFGTAGGYDVAHLYDSAGNDTFSATPTRATLRTPQGTLVVNTFDAVTAHATSGGNDTAVLYDSARADTFVAEPTIATLSGRGFSNSAEGFESVQAFSKAGGRDAAIFYDSAGNDVLVASYAVTRMIGPGYSNRADGFESVTVYGGAGGADRAVLYDTTGDDFLQAAGSRAAIQYSSGRSVEVLNFRRVCVNGMAGGLNTKHVEAIDFLLQTLGAWVDV